MVDSSRNSRAGLVDPSVGHRFDPFGADKKYNRPQQDHNNTPSTDSASSGSTHGKSKTNIHVRTNFGKNQQYVPPTRSPRREAAAANDDDDDDEEMPFDQMGLSRPVLVHPVSQTHRPFDEPSAFMDNADELVIVGPAPGDERTDTGPTRRNVQVLRAYYNDVDRFRSVSPPPIRPHSKSQPLSPVESEATYQMSNSRDFGYDNVVADKMPEENGENNNYEEFGLSPGSCTDSSPRKKRDTQGETDDDTLFNFDETADRNKARRVRRIRRNVRTAKEEDNSSVDEHDDTLQERAQQAYFRRNRPKKAVPQKPKHLVSFDKEPDTVHQFETLGEAADTETIASMRSMNSDYTKSIESEVEDLFKDFFFIGSGTASKPGRRAWKNQPANKHDLKKIRDDDSFLNDGSTLGTLDEVSTLETNFTNGTLLTVENVSDDDGSNSSPDNITPVKTQTKSQPPDAEDPLTMVWGFVEGGVSMIGEALGQISLPKTPSVCSPQKDNMEQDKDVDLVLYSSQPKKVKGKLATPDAKQKSEDTSSPLESAMSYAADLLLGSTQEDKVKADGAMYSLGPQVKDSSLERDPRLADLAIHAARSVHSLQGLKFNENDHNTELVTQVEFKVIKIGLPLGVLFQENEGGCWVAKVFPNGNVAKMAPGHSILVGDQLAAIDGRNAIEMKVDAICALISRAENTQSIELTFLRYTGPLSSLDGRIEEGGHEIADSSTDGGRTRSQRTASSDEHVFDMMHKKLPISLNEEKRNTKKNAKTQKKKEQVGKKPSKWFGRGTKKDSV